MPKVSIIVPVYNVQDYLRECMDSILAQTLYDIEVICVNDGSTDHSAEVLESYVQQDSRVKVLNKENTGYGASMNQGLKAASGEYIGVVEPDDFVKPEMYEELYQKAHEFQLDWVKGNFQVFKGSKEARRNVPVKVYLPKESKIYHIVLNPTDYPDLILYDDFYWKGIYQREFLLQNCIWFHETPGAAYQDNGFKYQTFCMAKRVMYIEKAYYWYRRDNPSASTYNVRGLEFMYGEYRFIREFMDRNCDRTEVFRVTYYKKLYFQFQEQLYKILDKEWEEVKPGKILDKYREEFSFGMDKGYLARGQVEEWLYSDVRFFVRYPQSYFKYKKVQKELEKEKNFEWLNSFKDRKVVLVCGGAKARQVINFFQINQVNSIVAICDNDESKWGKMLYEFSIIPTVQAVKEYAKATFLIAKAGDTQKLRKQLLELGVSEEKIVDISIGLSSFMSLERIV